MVMLPRVGRPCPATVPATRDGTGPPSRNNGLGGDARAPSGSNVNWPFTPSCWYRNMNGSRDLDGNGNTDRGRTSGGLLQRPLLLQPVIEGTQGLQQLQVKSGRFTLARGRLRLCRHRLSGLGERAALFPDFMPL